MDSGVACCVLAFVVCFFKPRNTALIKTQAMTKPLNQTNHLPASIEAQLESSSASLQIIRIDWREQTELAVEPLDHYQIDFCLSARLQGMSVCYPDHWGLARYERVGELLVIPPGQRLLARCDFPQGHSHHSHSSTVLRLAPHLVSEWLETDAPWSSEQLLAALDIDDQSIYSMMGRLTREALAVANTPAPASSQRLLQLIAEQLGIEVGRYFMGRNMLEFKGGLAAWRLRLIDERAQQLCKSPSIEELAALCKISARQLQRGFRVSRGCSIGRHIEHCRIENAKRLLQRGETIACVAATLGYASQSSFSYAFRRATGGTPSQFCRLI